MQVELKRMNQAVHFEAIGSGDVKVSIDGSESIGGENKGVRPMELILMGLAGCTAMDLVSILKKQKQSIEDINISVSGERAEGQVKPFTKIHLHYTFIGDADPKKIEKALNLSVEKYCSVQAMLVNVAITYDFELKTTE
ncbi:MAG: OsmC family protein [Cyclobacteriaceae bacterium]|nr:OsmC family protein [Cyclobacteriaceae bacterium]MCH8517983.1 OsmC family protein [Cyclobacteriaceae bacterium]